MPLTYTELCTLHYNTYKALAVDADKAKEPAKNPDIDTGLYIKYCKFQVAHNARSAFLRSGHFEKPETDGADKCMPKLLIKYNSKVRNQAPPSQPDTSYEEGASCAFDTARITAYEKANAEFKVDMIKPGAQSIPKLRELLLMDIAFLHLRNVKWAPKEAAHLSGQSRSDDDAPAEPKQSGVHSSRDPEPDGDNYDFTKWDSTDPETIPWDKLSLTLAKSTDDQAENQIPMYLLPALLLAFFAKSTGMNGPPEMDAFYDRCRHQIVHQAGDGVTSFLCLEIEPGQEQAPRRPPPSNLWNRASRKRDYTQEELEYIASIWNLAADVYDAEICEDFQGKVAEVARHSLPDDDDDQSEETIARTKTKRTIPPKSAASTEPAHKRVRREAARPPPARVVDRPATPVVTSDRTPSRARRGQGRKRSDGGSPNVEAMLNLPHSKATGRILLGQVSLNTRFPKGYISMHAPKKSPVKDLTLGKAWHTVRLMLLIEPTDYFRLPPHLALI